MFNTFLASSEELNSFSTFINSSFLFIVSYIAIGFAIILTELSRSIKETESAGKPSAIK